MAIRTVKQTMPPIYHTGVFSSDYGSSTTVGNRFVIGGYDVALASGVKTETPYLSVVTDQGTIPVNSDMDSDAWIYACFVMGPMPSGVSHRVSEGYDNIVVARNRLVNYLAWPTQYELPEEPDAQEIETWNETYAVDFPDPS